MRMNACVPSPSVRVSPVGRLNAWVTDEEERRESLRTPKSLGALQRWWVTKKSVRSRTGWA